MAITFLALGLSAGASIAEGNPDLVRRFVAAFNEHDVDAMLELAADDVRWLNVDDDAVSVQSDGKRELRKAMTNYFSEVPSARAEIRSVVSSGHFVHTVEEAFWQSDDGLRSQCSMAVYRIAGGTIETVWYFPAHECPPDSAADGKSES